MKKNGKRVVFIGSMFVVAFAVWTALIQIVDVQPIGQNGTDVGFASFNSWFHKLTGVHMTIYIITDWLGLIPFVSLIVVGVVKIFLTKLGIEKSHKIMTGLSMLLSVLMVLFLAMAREAYAIMLAFMLLLIKGTLLLKYIK